MYTAECDWHDVHEAAGMMHRQNNGAFAVEAYILSYLDYRESVLLCCLVILRWNPSNIESFGLFDGWPAVGPLSSKSLKGETAVARKCPHALEGPPSSSPNLAESPASGKRAGTSLSPNPQPHLSIWRQTAPVAIHQGTTEAILIVAIPAFSSISMPLFPSMPL